MQAGRLRHRIEIQVASTADGSFSKSQSVNYSTVTTVWGEIRPLTGKEFVHGRANDAQVTHEVTIRYYSGLTPRHRLKFGTRIFNIVQLRDIEERNRMMIVLVNEDV